MSLCCGPVKAALMCSGVCVKRLHLPMLPRRRSVPAPVGYVRYVDAHVRVMIGFYSTEVVCGNELRWMSDFMCRMYDCAPECSSTRPGLWVCRPPTIREYFTFLCDPGFQNWSWRFKITHERFKWFNQRNIKRPDCRHTGAASIHWMSHYAEKKEPNIKNNLQWRQHARVFIPRRPTRKASCFYFHLFQASWPAEFLKAPLLGPSYSHYTCFSAYNISYHVYTDDATRK